MQNKINRVLSLVLVVIMVLSMIPAAFAEEDSGSAAYAAENTTTGEQYADISDAIAEAQAGQTVKALADAQDVAYGNEGVILDLSGHDLTVTAAEGVTVSAIDSATDDYEGPYGTLTTEGKVATTVKTSGDIKSYVTIAENGSYSFHRYYASIAAISLKPAQAALGYRAEFRGDEAVKNAVVSYGYELWVNDNAHKTYTRTDALESGSLTLRLKNILAEGNDALNALGSTATIGGNAYIALDLGGEQVKLQGTEQLTTLRQVVESINANVSAYGEAQLQSVRDMITTYAAWMEGWNTDAIFGNGEGEGDDSGLDVEITVDVKAQDGVLAEDAVLSSDDITVTVPQGTVLEEGTTQLTLTIAQKASSDSGIAEEEGYSLLPLDVHIEGIAANNTTPIIVCLGEVLPKALNIGNYDLFHVEDGKTVPMTRVHTISELDAHNEFYYDPATGAVTVAMASFSEVALRSTAAQWTGNSAEPVCVGDTYYIYNADQLRGFAEMVGGMNGKTAYDFAGKTVILHADLNLNDTIDENGKVFYPVGYYNSTGGYDKAPGGSVSSGFKPFKGIFDGNGHTISNFYQNTWEMFGDYNDGYAGTPNHYRDGMGLFGKVYDGTVKNLTVENFSSDGEFTTTGTIAAYADNGATFENITIFDCNPRVYNIGNGGIVGCVGWYNNEVTDENPVTFKNITVDNSNKISALWGSWDVACGGLVGQYYPTSGQENETDNKGIHMENCHVTAQIDVNNDVCANYQYYAYRYAGILIGSVRENVNGDGSDLYPETGRVYPNMDGITAKECTVGFGDWNDYYYCELVANSLASYTHDYQFSRLTQVASVDAENMQVTTLKGETVAIPTEGRANYVVVTSDHATEHAVCYHFVDGNVWNHDDAGKETVNGQEVLIENNQHIYLEFNNLVTGYGWGVTSLGVTDMEGVEILDKNTAQKFKVYVDAETTFGSGAVVKLSDLFYSNHTVNNATVQAFVSPVGDDSTVTATYVADKEDWKNGTLTLSGKGAAEIIITDYYFCTATKLAVNVTEYTVSFAVPEGATKIAPMQSGEYGITLPTEHSFTDDGVEYSLVGWIEAPMAEPSSVQPELLESPYVATKNTLLYPVYSYSDNTSGETTWTLVTDASTLKAGDQLVIAAFDSNHALGITQNSNNRAAVTITKDGNTITINDSVQVLTLKNGNETNTFAFYTGSGYLYAASSSNNYLRTENTLSDNSSWTISITSAGVATVTAQGTNTRNLLKKNSSSALFSCYGSGQNDVSLYRKTAAGDATTMYGSFVEACTHNYENGVCTICSAIKPSPYVVTDIGKITAEKNVIITMTDSEGNTYALYSGNGASSAPTAVKVNLVEGKIETADESILWNITNNDGQLTIYPAGTTATWLYCYDDNKGLRVGTGEDNIFVIDDTYGYLYNNGQSRYIGVFDCQDWRSYTTEPDNNNIKDQTLAFYMQEISCAHENTEDVEAVDATCGAAGYTAGTWCNDCQTYISGHETISATGEHSLDAGEVTTPATCGEAGVKTYSCTVCDYTRTEEIAATGEHTFTDGTCSVCGADDPAVNTALATFEFGANGEAKQYDGTENSSYSETNNGYTLNITSGVKMYTGARDAKGNSCIKLATGSAAGSFSFTVPDAVNKVVIHVAGYTKNAATVTVNGQATYITTLSNDGAYTKITVDTSSSKTVSFNAETDNRVMINTIEYFGTAGGGNEGGESSTDPVLTITAANFNSTSYTANNNEKTENGYSYTTYQVMKQSSEMQWQKGAGSLTIENDDFTKLEIKVTSGTFTVTVGGVTVAPEDDGTYDLTGKTGEIKISVGSDTTGKTEYLKFYA